MNGRAMQSGMNSCTDDSSHEKKEGAYVRIGMAQVRKGQSFGHLAPKVYFKSPVAKSSKMAPPGVVGLLIGYEVQPGGRWTGAYLVVRLKDFEAESTHEKY